MPTRVAIITGGAKGIGRAIGLSLASDGWEVATCYRTSAAAAEDTAHALSQLGVRTVTMQCDVGDPRQCEALVERVQRELGQVDALINAAGPYHRIPLLSESPEGWQQMLDTNLSSVFYMSRLVAPLMQQRAWGRIVSFSMANADRMAAQPQVTAHYIAKAGVLILTRTLARLLAPHGITVNAISPGFISSGSAPEAELEKMVKNIPAGYVGDVTDAVSATRYLLSDEARYVNGANLHLSGAWGV